MSETPEPVLVSPDALKARLGAYATGASRDVRAAAATASGERLEAVAIAMWRRRGWVVVATDVGLHLARHPWVLGRRRTHSMRWTGLTGVATGPQRATFDFGDAAIALAATGPHREFVRLVETARRALRGVDVVPVEELRALARTKLGRLLTFGLEATIDALPDHLRAGERVERLAGAALDFDGLLVLTDHRLLLLASAVRSSSDRRWSIERDAIAGVEADGDALHLRMTDGNTHALTGFTPPDRLAEFHVVLAHGP